MAVGTEGGDEYSHDMVSDRDKAIIATLAHRYGAATVWLFGSSADRRHRGRDLDLAVEGVEPAWFFKFVGDLMLSLSQPVDVIALEKRSKLLPPILPLKPISRPGAGIPEMNWCHLKIRMPFFMRSSAA